MLLFKDSKAENTITALTLAIDKAKELDTDIVLSSNSGDCAFKALKLAKEADFSGKIIVVTQVWGMSGIGKNPMPEQARQKLSDAGAILITAAHTLSGAERALSGKFTGVYPVEIIAYTLRMISQGVKVAVEIAAMALDAGALPEPYPVLALGGSSGGLDTACLLTPGYSAKIFDTKVHEILCKPY